MIHGFSFKNFYSFRDWCDISLEVRRQAPGDARFAEAPTGERIAKLMAVIGPNGSGKTNLIKPLVFLNGFLKESFQHEPEGPIPIRTHFFSDEEAAQFELRFDQDGARWRYELAVTRGQVMREALFRKTSTLFSYVFKRHWDEAIGAYEIKQQGFGLRPGEAARVRRNASLIATAAQYEIPLASRLIQLPLYTNLVESGRGASYPSTLDRATWLYLAMPQVAKRMNSLLQGWDLGLQGVELRPVKLRDQHGQEGQVLLPFGIHRRGGREVSLDLAWESSGTQGAYRLLSHLLPALESGGVAVIDELESDLHPHMLVPILDLFISPETNPRQAQLIFTCHAPEVLNLLHKSQVMLVEKSDQGASNAWRLDTVRGVRNDDNLYGRYMAGAFAAVPEV